MREREVLALEESGHVVLRRVDMNAELLLGIWQAISPPTAGPSPRDLAAKPAAVGTSEDGRHINEGAPWGAPSSNAQ
jgi:hypothetical protein